MSRLTQGPGIALRIRGYHPLWPAFPDRSASQCQATGLFRVRSPLLTESRLMSFPPGTEMFQFPGFASIPYVFRYGSLSRGGLPHSDIHGSTPARGSPWLLAACHVLHRLLVPRHPPDALLILILECIPRDTSSTTMHRVHPDPKASPPGQPIHGSNHTRIGVTDPVVSAQILWRF